MRRAQAEALRQREMVCGLASHFGSIPSLNRWKSVPGWSRLGGTMLLYRLRAPEKAPIRRHVRECIGNAQRWRAARLTGP